MSPLGTIVTDSICHLACHPPLSGEPRRPLDPDLAAIEARAPRPRPRRAAAPTVLAAVAMAALLLSVT